MHMQFIATVTLTLGVSSVIAEDGQNNLFYDDDVSSVIPLIREFTQEICGISFNGITAFLNFLRY